MCFGTTFAGNDVWSFYLFGFVFAVVGLWVIWQPQGILGWVKQAHKEVDADDPPTQRFARFVGGGLILFALVLLLGLIMSR